MAQLVTIIMENIGTNFNFLHISILELKIAMVQTVRLTDSNS